MFLSEHGKIIPEMYLTSILFIVLCWRLSFKIVHLFVYLPMDVLFIHHSDPFDPTILEFYDEK